MQENIIGVIHDVVSQLPTPNSQKQLREFTLETVSNHPYYMLRPSHPPVFKWKVIPSGNSNSNEAWSQKERCEEKLKYKKKGRKKTGKSNQRNELIKRGMVFVQGGRTQESK